MYYLCGENKGAYTAVRLFYITDCSKAVLLIACFGVSLCTVFPFYVSLLHDFQSGLGS